MPEFTCFRSLFFLLVLSSVECLSFPINWRGKVVLRTSDVLAFESSVRRLCYGESYLYLQGS
jgi:hypothetical protein